MYHRDHYKNKADGILYHPLFYLLYAIIQSSFWFSAIYKITTILIHYQISQTELALKIGVHANVLGRYERDETLPSIEVASKIAKAL